MAGKAEQFVPSRLIRLPWKKDCKGKQSALDILDELNWWLKKNTDYGALGMKEEGVDYSLSLSLIQIEVKNTDKSGVMSDMPSQIQRDLLDEYGGYIFAVFWDAGYPRLPKGADGYLVPWERYKKFIDEDTAVKGKSIRRHRGPRAFGASDYLSEYRVEWIDSGFVIPPDHIFWETVSSKVNELEDQLHELQDMIAFSRMFSKEETANVETVAEMVTGTNE